MRLLLEPPKLVLLLEIDPNSALLLEPPKLPPKLPPLLLLLLEIDPESAKS